MWTVWMRKWIFNCLILINLKLNLNGYMLLVATLLDSSVLLYKNPLEWQFCETKDRLCHVPCCSFSILNCVWHVLSAQEIVDAWIKLLEVRNRKIVRLLFALYNEKKKISMTIWKIFNREGENELFIIKEFKF